MPEPTTPEPAATAEPAPTRRTRAATAEPEPIKTQPTKAEPPASRPTRPAPTEPATATATAATDEHPPAAKPRRRQARGERRIAQLLDAAASVFCTSGYTAASTNAIAREAGVSPGTLYQFFPNKEAIAVELGGRLP